MAGYGDDAGFNSWLADNGFVIPATAPAVAVLRQRGADYVDSAYASRLLCTSPTGGLSQERAWPRSGGDFPDDVVPAAWIKASYRAAYLEAISPGQLSLTINPNGRIKRQKVEGAVEREFFDGGNAQAGSAGGLVLDTLIDGLVTPYLCSAEDPNGAFVWAVGS